MVLPKTHSSSRNDIQVRRKRTGGTIVVSSNIFDAKKSNEIMIPSQVDRW